ncbi:TonB-dependent receptor [Providencia hangzhouensis]
MKKDSLCDVGLIGKKLEFRITEVNHVVKWKVDENNRFVAKNNPFYNGEVDLKEEKIDPVTGLKAKKYLVDRDINNSQDEVKYSNKQKFKAPKRNEESAWAPALGATIYLTENDRIFGRYLETVRMPSIFEDTIGFSGGREPNYTPPVYLPERSHTIELGYVRNFQDLVAAENHADLRINYYNTVVTNAFDRNDRLVFTQVDKHNTAGLELLARYDNGWVFGDLGVDYRLKNEVCDEVSLMVMDPYNQFGGSECTTAGFPGGYLRTQLQPKYSIHANLGLRFLDERLEVGSRMRYHSKAKNEDEAEMMDKYPYQYAPLNNDPMSWNAVFTADAYVNYQFNKDLSFELLATNLFDEYYIDPLTRSMMPAPGRTVRFNITSRF